MTVNTSSEHTCFNLKTALVIGVWLILFGLGLEFLDQVYEGATFEALDLSREHNDHLMIVIGGVLFLALWAFLERYIFAPYLSLFVARENATQGASSSAAELRTKTEKLVEDYEEEILQARTELMQQKLQKITAAKKEADQILGNADKEASSLLNNEREVLASQLSDLRRKIESEGDAMVEEVVRKLSSPSSI